VRVFASNEGCLGLRVVEATVALPRRVGDGCCDGD
jgi:hypothetical protein